MRRGNLDYLDASSLEFYLDESTTSTGMDYDVAVMFYAQRDSASHRIAPVWNQISKILDAGTKASNLIVSLFDCESTVQHTELCQKARVTHYPSFVYASLAANHTLTFQLPRHVVHYPGKNWQQGDAILDWLKAMQAMSRWHRSGWSQRIRRIFFPFLFKADHDVSQQPLPLGPPNAQVDKAKLEELTKVAHDHQALATRTGHFVDSILFPLSAPNAPRINPSLDSTHNYTDVFAWLFTDDGWNSTAKDDLVLRSCTVELSADYCERWSTLYMEEWIEALPAGKFALSDDDLQGFAKNLTSYLEMQEPYCAILDDCVAMEFAGSDCRPKSCPFKDPTACRYLTSCLKKSLQDDYAEALDLLVDVSKQVKTDQEPNNKSATKSTSGKEGTGSTKARNKWGL